MMRRFLIILMACLLAIRLQAQRISHTYDNVPLSDVLRELSQQSSDYTLYFLYDELEDFRITTNVSHKTLPDAIQQMIGFYPIRMTVDKSDLNEKKIFVECTHKTDRHLTGTIIDEQDQPVAYANIAVLNPADSTLLSGGVSNESGYFAVPYEIPPLTGGGQEGAVLARISYVGYRTIYRLCHHSEVGTIKMQPETYTINGVKVTGNRRIIKSQTDRLQYIVSADEFAKGLTAYELMRRVPLLQTSEDAVNIVGKGSTHFLLNGRELPDNMVQTKLRSLKSEDIERIEVITIPPSKYKAEANAGYVNVVLRRDQTLGLRGDLVGNLYFKEHTNWSVNPSLNYATQKLDVSFSAGVNGIKGINDHSETTTFGDHEKSSEYVRRFDWKIYTANLLAKYQLNKRVDFGLMGGLSTMQSETHQHDVTREWGKETESDMVSPNPKSGDLYAELFLDWMMDQKGKMMTLTYDYFVNDVKQDERLMSSAFKMQTTGSNLYRIDAWKMDFNLPSALANFETGLHYTHIGNTSEVNIFDNAMGTWQKNLSQSNEYDYTEQTAAAYVSGQRQLGSKISIKAGLRLEKTWIEGQQITTGSTNRDQYLYLFPTIHFGWQATEKAYIGAAYSKGIERPNFQYLNPFRYYMTPTHYFAGNPYLTPGLTDNVEVNFNNGRGLYVVLYESHQSNALGTLTSFPADDVQSTTVENSFSADKMGLYASWQRNLFPWWNVNVGGEVFYAQSISTKESTHLKNLYSWSGKVELSSDWFLNHAHTLVLNASYSHYLPCVNMNAKYEGYALLYAQLRYSLLNNRLRLSLSVSDPFRQNIYHFTSRYTDYTVRMTNYAHPHSITLSASWSFGGDKVRRSYRQSKNTEASRATSR